MNYYVYEENGMATVYVHEREDVKLLKVLSEKEWNDCGGLARLIDGELILGKTEAEKEEDEKNVKRQKIQELKHELELTDYVAAKIAEGAATREEYKEVLEYRQKCRDEINSLEEELGDNAVVD